MKLLIFMYSQIYHNVHNIKALDPNLSEVNWFYTISLRKNEKEFKNNSYTTEVSLLLLKLTSYRIQTEYGIKKKFRSV